MKKVLMLTVLIVLFMAHASAQKMTFKKGDNLLNFGVGFGSPLYWGVANQVIIPPIHVGYELGIVDGILDKGAIGVGGLVALSSAKNTDAGSYTDFIFGARGNFHYTFVPKLDAYAGILIGYDYTFHSQSGPEYVGRTAGPIASPFLGGRYYFTENFAVMSELGYTPAILTVGLSLKF
jgi:hypothetical protein